MYPSLHHSVTKKQMSKVSGSFLLHNLKREDAMLYHFFQIGTTTKKLWLTFGTWSSADAMKEMDELVNGRQYNKHHL